MNEVVIHVRAKDDASKTMKQVEGHTSKIDTASRKMAVGVGVAAAAVGTVLVGALKDSIAEARESIKVTNQTNAVLKSTGGVANISAKGVEKLATAISNKTGIDDEAIQSGENLLLTFTNIRNEVGKGNDIFNQATQTITDMSVALGQDMKSSAIQVGKALNDPVKGMTALSRVGVSFTEKQKDMVKHLEKTGHHLEAQKIILHELKKEFGGSAEAAATWADKAKVASDNIKESFGKKLLPALEKVSKWFVTDGADAIQGFTDSLDTQKLNDTADSIITIGNAMGTVTKALGKWDKMNGRGFTTFGVNLAQISEAFVTWKVIVLESLATVAEAWAKSPLAPKGAKRAAGALRGMAESAKAEFNNIQASARMMADKVNRLKIVAKLKADKKDAQAKIDDIDRRLKKTHNAKVISKLRADKAQAQAAIRSINAQLNQLDGKKADTWIRTHRVTYYGTKGKPPTNPHGDHKATGGVTSAATGGERGNQVWVGEEGPELVDLPGGSHVNSNPDSMRMSGKGGGGGGVHFHFHGPVYGDHNALKRALVNMKRAGDLDLVLR